MHVRQRKALGCFVLLAYLTVYTIAAVTLGSTLIATWPNWAQLAYYVIAGFAWVAPLKPLFAWMNGVR